MSRRSGPGSPIKDMRRLANLERIPSPDHEQVVQYEWDAL
jgi:hypothetical protein